MKTILAAVALTVASFGTFAQEATVFDVDVASTTSRADVRAATLAALARGEPIRHGEAAVVDFASLAGSSRSRAEVHAEVFAALQRGEPIRFGEAPPAGAYDSLSGGRTMLAWTARAN